MSLKDDFYGSLIDDYLDMGKRSIIYRYYLEEARTGKGKPGIREQFERLGENPAPKDLRAFTVRLLKQITKRPVMYNYQDKIRDQREDLLSIYETVRPFIRIETDSIEKLADELREEIRRNSSGDSVIRKKFSKNKINTWLKGSIDLVGNDAEEIKKEDVEKLIDLITDRVIYKSFDDFLYTAGYHIVLHPDRVILDSGFEGENPEYAVRTEKEDLRYERIGDGKGRKTGKTDKTLDLLIRYHRKYGELPFKKKDLSDPEYLDMCKKLFTFLMDTYRDNIENGLSNNVVIPLAVDTFTGCSLQLLGKYYYTLKQKTVSGKTVFKPIINSPYAFAVFTRSDDRGKYVYEYRETGAFGSGHMLYTDLDEAVNDYFEKVTEIRDEITESNYDFLFTDAEEERFENLPVVFRGFFGEEYAEKLKEYKELVDDTKKDLSEYYKEEEGDPEYLGSFREI